MPTLTHRQGLLTGLVAGIAVGAAAMFAVQNFAPGVNVIILLGMLVGLVAVAAYSLISKRTKKEAI